MTFHAQLAQIQGPNTPYFETHAGVMRCIAQSVACATHVPKALQRTRVRLPARVPLLHVTPHLLPCFLSKLFSYSVNKAEKGQKIL